jgi:uncharacterized protein YbbC (DUF1343 family)
MMRNETMDAPSPIAMLTMAILKMVDEKPSLCSLLILFDMKYERFKEWLNFGFIDTKHKKEMIRLLTFFFLLLALSCSAQPTGRVLTGADQFPELTKKIKSKRVALVVNNTALIGKTHLADSLKSAGVALSIIFGPEHGFRGDAADGELIKDSMDAKTGVLVASLYGKNKKPSVNQLSNVDVVIFDIQDVGARFYTYISTLHLVMEACAENNKQLIVLDRPNPNGGYADGPILQPELKSFVGMHPIPIAHGLTVGELAMMINGEGWLEGGKKCNVEVIKIKNWKHDDDYSLPVRPSPNLPNDQSIRLYPSLCLFEGTAISVGRGTTMQFQVLGNPDMKDMPFQFTPVSMKGISNTPPHQDKLCYGIDLRNVKPLRKIDLSYLLQFYKAFPDKEKFWGGSFNRLAGTTALKQQIIDGLTEEQIRASWDPGLSQYKEKRKKYLLYP